jgi:hypothetical protein
MKKKDEDERGMRFAVPDSSQKSQLQQLHTKGRRGISANSDNGGCHNHHHHQQQQLPLIVYEFQAADCSITDQPLIQ